MKCYFTTQYKYADQKAFMKKKCIYYKLYNVEMTQLYSIPVRIRSIINTNNINVTAIMREVI